MKLYSAGMYRFYRVILTVAFRFVHPIVRVKGRENIPQGAAMLCCNHSAFSDPIWIILTGRFPTLPRTMAKIEIIETPVLGKLLQKLGAFPVDREHRDIGAIRTAMRALRDGSKVLIFPEGTRIRKGKTVTPHNGAVMIAHRSHVPIVPIYLSTNKRFWAPLKVVFGKPFYPEFSTEKPTAEEMDACTENMMREIYAMGNEQ